MESSLLANVGLRVPTILLPKGDVDLSKWAVVACDQVANSPSTYNIIFPEAFIHDPHLEEKIAEIQNNQRKYLNQVLQPLKPGFVLVERTIRGKARQGLVVAIDLENYEYDVSTSALCKASEKTDLKRLEARTQVRQGSVIETSHVLVLFDDPELSIVEPLFKLDLPKLYDINLMENGGRVQGWHLTQESIIQSIAEKFNQMLNKKGNKNLLYAVGDGNHSLASAKSCWQKLKEKDPSIVNKFHPARYSLVELVNLHNPGLDFEPIHRVIFNVDADEFAHFCQNFTKNSVQVINARDKNEMLKKYQELMNKQTPKLHVFPFVSQNKFGLILFHNVNYFIEYQTIQEALDAYHQQSGRKIDYIHDEEALESLCVSSNNLGIYMQPLDRFGFFKSVEAIGRLPKKSFSLGSSYEKKYYIECQKIIPDIRAKL